MTSLLSRLPSRLPRSARSPRALALAAAALVALAGLGLVLLAAARATVWAPETVTTARVTGEAGAPVIVTTPAATALDGPSLRIEVRGPADKPAFVGVGRADDVAAYLGAAARIEVTGASDGAAVQTRQGAEAALPDPTGVDLWAESATGRGTASLTWIQEPGRWRVLAAVDGATAPTEVVLTWERARASSSAPALFAVGGLLLALGVVGAWAARRVLAPSGGRDRPAPPAPGAGLATVLERATAARRSADAATPSAAPTASAPGAVASGPGATPPSGTPAPGVPAPGTPAPGTPAPGTPAPGTRRSARLGATGEQPPVPVAPDTARQDWVDRHRAGGRRVDERRVDEPRTDERRVDRQRFDEHRFDAPRVGDHDVDDHDEPEEEVAPAPFRQPPRSQP